ncbi:MAG: monooxygenase [Nitriliruptoraceae bacterium]|jgi:monooxygenase
MAHLCNISIALLQLTRPTIEPSMRDRDRHTDVLIVGAGLSGIGVAARLVASTPDRSFAILEMRQAIGGTWDQFRYPGIRCDSDVQTLGYGLKPWSDDSVITEGGDVRRYIEETADEYGIREHISFGHKVTTIAWSSMDAQWTVTAHDTETEETVVRTASFVVCASGYFDYDEAHVPELPGTLDFKGQIVHPQFWGEEHSFAGKDVVVVGSGATAITLIPAMAKAAKSVTMLQRSPGYVLSVPSTDPTTKLLRSVLPDDLVGHIARVRNTGIQLAMFQLARKHPKAARTIVLNQVRAQLRGKVDMKHFTPSYDVWDERLCVVPDGDLFRTLRNGEARIVTDHIDTFTETGIQTQSGEHLDADLVVLATGFKIKMLGGITVEVDGEQVHQSDKMTYRGIMFSDIPNFAMIFGYVNVSWTRKVDIAAQWLVRVLHEMDRRGADTVVATGGEEFATDDPFTEMSSGYMQRASGMFPMQGSEAPWRNQSNVLLDTVRLRLRSLDDGFLRFTSGPPDGADPLAEAGNTGGIVRQVARLVGL